MPITTAKYKSNKTLKKTSKNKKTFEDFNLATEIFENITLKKEQYKNDKYLYWIISKKYNHYLDNAKYTITHFLLYCLLRFHNSPYKELINNFANFPTNFPTNISFRHSSKYKYISFNYLLYLINFIYFLLENNLTVKNLTSGHMMQGYNISIDKTNDIYNIFFVNQNKIIINNRYPVNKVNNYIQNIKLYITKNYSFLIDNNLLSNIIQFYNNHKLDFNNKFIIVDKLYIPKCHINLYESFTNDIMENLLQYEIPYNRVAQRQKITNVFNKLRSVDTLKKDLETANVSVNDYNDMIRSIKPIPFKNKQQYRNFIKELVAIISTKLQNYTIKIIGSSTTFYSANPKNDKVNKVFDEQSDIDVNIIPNENIDIHKPLLENMEGIDKDALGYISNFNIYVTSILINFFGENIMQNFFDKWGPKQTKGDSNEQLGISADIKKSKTILKHNISITMSTKKDMYDRFDIIRNNKTCLSNFASFIQNGTVIHYWNENNQLIIEHI